MPDGEVQQATTAISHEALARYAQGLLAERPVVVLGTGATIPHGLPSMQDLADNLCAVIKDDPPGWQEFTSKLRESGDLEFALHEVNLPRETVERLIVATWDLVCAKDLGFYAQLVTGGVQFPLAELFQYLLRTADAHVRVVTTNYDRVAEYAANITRAYVSTGMSSGWIQRFIPASVNNERMQRRGYEGQVTVLKVHGSLDWFQDAAGDVVGVPLSRVIPPATKPLVVTPGVSKYREVLRDPFRTIMATADVVLSEARSYVCIGYGFNDEHVQPILLRRVIKEGVPLVIITKKLTDQAREAILSSPPKKFLIFEEGREGCVVYSPMGAEGVSIEGAYWRLGDFVSLVRGERGGRDGNFRL